MFALLLALFVVLVAADDSCSACLEQALFRPKVCGIEYFDKVSCEIDNLILAAPLMNDAQVAQLCLQFSQKHQVGLGLLNAQGINLCTLTNPTAGAYILIGKSLLRRSASDRYAIYHHYDRPGYDLPPLGDPDMDIIGMLKIYQSITIPYNSNRQANLIPAVMSVVEYINSYPDSGPQSVIDIQSQMLFATLVASVPAALAKQYFLNVWLLYVGTPLRYVGPFYLSYYTSAFLLEILSWTGVWFNGRISYPQRLINYSFMRNDMLLYQDAFGIVKSFSQPVVVNVNDEGLCSYAYNLERTTGGVFRVVLSQTELLFKK